MPKDGADLSGGTKVSLTLSLVRSAKKHRLCQRGRGRRGTGLRVPHMEATKDRTLEMEGWGSRREFVPRPVAMPCPIGKRKGRDLQMMRSQSVRPCWILIPQRSFWRGSYLTAPDAGPGPGGGPADVKCLKRVPGRFLANSHVRSDQTGIGLGRTLMRIGRCFTALKTDLFPVA